MTISPKVTAMPTCETVPLLTSLTMMAPVPAKTRQNVPMNSEISFFINLHRNAGINQKLACESNYPIPFFLRMKPLNSFVGAEPCELALGEMAGVALHKSDRFIKTDLATEVKADLAVADALQRREIQAVSSFHEALHLLDKTIADHLIAAPIDLIIKLLPVTIESDL